MRIPTFPHSGKHANHCRAALALLLEGGRIDQFSYFEKTGLPLVDFRTRISNLTLKYRWPIEREFHTAYDFNGELRRVKEYWLDREIMREYFAADPVFKARCESFVREYGGVR